MKGSKHICLLCRLHVANATSRSWDRVAQRQAQIARTFNTSSKCAFSTTPSSASESSTAGTATSTPFRLVSARREPPGLKSNVQPSKPATPGQAPSTRIEALFKMVMDDQERPQGDAAPATVSVDLDLVKAIAKLQDMVASKAPVADAYSYFRTEVYPTIHTAGVYLPQAYHKVKSAMLEKLVEAKKGNMVAEELPLAAEILRLYAEGAQIQPAKWAELVAELVKSIIAMDPLAEAKDIDEQERLRARREVMLMDLVESWKVLSHPRSSKPVISDNERTGGFFGPVLTLPEVKKLQNTGNFDAAVGVLFPQYPKDQLASVSLLSAATFALLHDGEICTTPVRESASRFMAKIQFIVKTVRPRPETLAEALRITYPELEDYVMTLWVKIQKLLDGMAIHIDEPPLRKTAAATPAESGGVRSTPPDIALLNVKRFLYRVNQACRLGNAGELDRLWKEFVGPDDPIPQARAKDICNNVKIIDNFIKAFTAVNQPEKAVMAWNTQLKLGIRPTLKTWDNLLTGLRNAKNLAGLKNMWTRLTRSGLRLDTVVWTSRIAGLIELGDVEGGLDALNEMVELWKAGDDNAVEPTIEPVNAALAGLIAFQQHDAAGKLVDWAVGQGIKPDTFTFNTVLRPILRDPNRGEDAEKIFAAMQDQGVRANEATFTLILDASFSQGGMDPKEQERTVARVHDAMVASNLELNTQTYAKMLYLLLRSNATTAAMALVGHLLRENITLTPQIYTMLAQHCFSLRPPDIRGVQQLIQWRKWADVDDKDIIFYERVVDGLTRNGEIDSALEVYMRVAPAGVRLDMPTLSRLLHALLRVGRLDDARKLASTEKAMFESKFPDASPTEHVGYWHHQFWQLAAHFRLLSPETEKYVSRAAAARGERG